MAAIDSVGGGGGGGQTTCSATDSLGGPLLGVTS